MNTLVVTIGLGILFTKFSTFGDLPCYEAHAPSELGCVAEVGVDQGDFDAAVQARCYNWSRHFFYDFLRRSLARQLKCMRAELIVLSGLYLFRSAQ